MVRLIMNKDCDNCYKIICRNCLWKAEDTEVLSIQSGEISACPICGWELGEPTKKRVKEAKNL